MINRIHINWGERGGLGIGWGDTNKNLGRGFKQSVWVGGFKQSISDSLGGGGDTREGRVLQGHTM